MMAMNRPYKVTMALVSVVGFLALSVGVTNEMKRRSLMNDQKNVIASLSSEIDAYKDLGFNDQDTVIEVTKGRMVHAKEQLELLKVNTKVLFKKDARNLDKKEKLESLMKINQEMATSYKSEIQECRKLGLTDSHKPMKSAKQNLAQLVVEMANIERELELMDSAPAVQNPMHQQIQKLIALNRDSLELYKAEMNEYTQLGLAEKDPKVRYVRERMINKAAEIEALEKHLR